MFSQKNAERKTAMYDVVRYECPFSRNGNPTFTFNAEYIVVHRRDVECAFSGGIRSKPYSTENEAIEAITGWKEKRNCK